MEELLRKSDLHEYQRYSKDFIIEHPVTSLFLDCGLGKTITSLTAIEELLFDYFDVHRVLVVCPLRVGRVWADEIQHWEHLSNLRYSIAIGTESERIAALHAKADIYIINRENVQWLIEKSGQPFKFDMLVIDELSSFRIIKLRDLKHL